MPESILFWTVAPLAVLLVAISKGGFAGGTAVIGVPAMALAIDPVAAAGIMLPLLIFMDVIALRAYWGQWHRLNARILITGAIVGIAAGWASFRFFEPDGVRLLLGVITLVFSLNYWLRRQAVLAREPQGPSFVKGGFWGAVAGFTTFIAHAGAPPFSVYMLPQKLHRTLFQATSVLFFATVNLVKLGPYAQLGLLHGGNLWTSLALAPLVPIGMILGIWLHKKVSDALFVGIIYAALLLLGAKLTWDGVTGLYF